MKTYNLGSKSVDNEPLSKDMAYYPSFHLDSKKFPPMKKWEVGKKYKVTIELQMTRKSENEKKRIDGGFDVLKIITKDKVDKIMDKIYPE